MSLFQARNFISYWLDAVDEHSLHSPFIFEFYKKIAINRQTDQSFAQIESIRDSLLDNNNTIRIRDFGAGSRVDDGKERQVKEVAKSGLSSPRFGQFLFHLIKNHQFKNAIELGTSFGINTLYMAKANPEMKIHTFEGCPESILIAKRCFKYSQTENIKIIEGNIDETLPDFISSCSIKADLIYFDANHRYEPTIKYYNLLREISGENSIFIFDDIYWSSEMKKSWVELKNKDEVTLSLDLFDAGILFFDRSLSKESYRLMF